MFMPAFLELDWNGWPITNWPHFWFGYLPNLVKDRLNRNPEIIIKYSYFEFFHKSLCNFYFKNMSLHVNFFYIRFT